MNIIEEAMGANLNNNQFFFHKILQLDGRIDH